LGAQRLRARGDAGEEKATLRIARRARVSGRETDQGVGEGHGRAVRPFEHEPSGHLAGGEALRTAVRAGGDQKKQEQNVSAHVGDSSRLERETRDATGPISATRLAVAMTPVTPRPRVGGFEIPFAATFSER